MTRFLRAAGAADMLADMATLSTARGGGGAREIALPAHCLVGRSSACTLRVEEPKASREHARLHFQQGTWTVRDLGTTNGTFVNGERLAAGATKALSAGDRLGFGDAADVWTLIDASPPGALARRLDTDERIVAEGGVLALPSADAPLAVALEVEGAWIVEIDGRSRPARDGEELRVGGVAYALHLPEASVATANAAGLRRLADVELRFRVSRDEERVEVTVVGPWGAHVLPPRAHHYAWLTIARARMRDRDLPGLAEAQRGWIGVEDLCEALRLDEAHLNVELHRIRKGIAAIELVDGAGVIERRRNLRQLRLGTSRAVITTEE